MTVVHQQFSKYEPEVVNTTADPERKAELEKSFDPAHFCNCRITSTITAACFFQLTDLQSSGWKEGRGGEVALMTSTLRFSVSTDLWY